MLLDVYIRYLILDVYIRTCLDLRCLYKVLISMSGGVTTYATIKVRTTFERLSHLIYVHVGLNRS